MNYLKIRLDVTIKIKVVYNNVFNVYLSSRESWTQAVNVQKEREKYKFGML